MKTLLALYGLSAIGVVGFALYVFGIVQWRWPLPLLPWALMAVFLLLSATLALAPRVAIWMCGLAVGTATLLLFAWLADGP